MKALLIHNFYTQLTGEDLSVNETAKLLKQSGKIEIIEYYAYSRSFSHIPWPKRIVCLIKAALPFFAPRDFKALLEKEKPQIAQFYNLIPFINTSVIRELKKRKIPVICSAVNYRIFCPRGTCFLKNTLCVRCYKKSVIHCIINNCLDNILYSILYALQVSFLKRSIHNIDLFLFISKYQDNFYQTMLSRKPTRVLRDYLEIPEKIKSLPIQKEKHCLVVGRFVKEKGIPIILEAAGFLPEISFKIYGQGPEYGLYVKIIKEKGLRNVQILDWVDKNDCLYLIKRSRLLIVPSLFYETCCRVVREAMSLGTPVIASLRGGPTELIEHGKTGFLFDPENAPLLITLIERIWFDENLNVELSNNALRAARTTELNADEYIASLLSLWTRLIKDNCHLEPDF